MTTTERIAKAIDEAVKAFGATTDPGVERMLAEAIGVMRTAMQIAAQKEAAR